MKWYISIILGAAVRYLLMHSEYAVTIQNRVEVATPINSWKRGKLRDFPTNLIEIKHIFRSVSAIEGAYLYANGTNPYDGDLYHQNPLVLASVWYLFQQAANIISMTFIQLEVGTILMLKVAAAVFIKELYNKQRERSQSFAKGTKELQISIDDLENVPYYVALAYMFNPYSILNCVGQTTTVLSNFLLALFLLGTSYRLRIIACLALALETQINIYPCVLIIPSALFIAEQDKNKTLSITTTCLTFLLAFLAVNYTAFGIIGDWSFLDATYGFM